MDVEDDDNIVTVAFNKAWRFIENDPFLAHNSELVLRDRLPAHLEILIKVGHNLLDRATRHGEGKVRASIAPLPTQVTRGRARFAPNQCKYGPAHHTLAPVVSMKSHAVCRPASRGS